VAAPKALVAEKYCRPGQLAKISSSASHPCTSVSPIDLINPGLLVTGHPSGTARDVEETMHFAVPTGIRAVVEERPVAQAAQGYEASHCPTVASFPSTRARRQ
jgi:D-arabinose 1-dehydrogenase-like Zn-dependent alcohol dehydrogenase